MNFAILAAGRGERLSEVKGKPMARINSKPMIARLLDIMLPLVGADDEVRVIISPAFPLVAAELHRWHQSSPCVRLNVMQRQTASPVESLARLLDGFEGDDIVVVTVDSVFSASALRRFASHWSLTRRSLKEDYPLAGESNDLDALMGVTRTVDDEKPLYVAVSNSSPLMVTSFIDEGCTPFVSAGVYALSRRAIDIAVSCYSNGITRLRNFQRTLLNAGLRVGAFDLGATVDVDRPSDLAEAAKIDSLNPS